MSYSSRAIVGFIANLLPLYGSLSVEGKPGAVDLGDGTRILPIDGDHDEPWVSVHWQGDADRSQDAVATMIATLAVVRYVQLHSVGFDNALQRAMLEQFGQHFNLKTGHSLYLPYHRETDVRGSVIQSFAGHVGMEALRLLVSRAIGG